MMFAAMTLTLLSALSLAATPAPEPVRVAVLATPHLAGAPDGFELRHLEPVLARLEAFEPTLILVEGPDSEHLRLLKREAAAYPGLAEQFGRDALALSALAGDVTSLTPAEAELEARSLGAAPTGPQARRQAVLMNARSGEPAAAIAHWLQLGSSERMEAPINLVLADALDRIAARRNETYLIGSQLAARLGHGAVYGFDDWSAGDLFLAAIPDLQTAMETDPALRAVLSSDVVVEGDRRSRSMDSAVGVLDAYRYFNAAGPQAARADEEWDAFLAVRSHPEAARARLAAWEARNLRMAANIVERAGGRPGARVLVIVGASHKPYLAASLSGIAGLEIVETEPLLAVE